MDLTARISHSIGFMSFVAVITAYLTYFILSRSLRRFLPLPLLLGAFFVIWFIDAVVLFIVGYGNYKMIPCFCSCGGEFLVAFAVMGICFLVSPGTPMPPDPAKPPPQP